VTDDEHRIFMREKDNDLYTAWQREREAIRERKKQRGSKKAKHEGKKP
jgi:hypothetical protein